jgi:tripartite-type tricarboxylate transporter receptor subunit TctC
MHPCGNQNAIFSGSSPGESTNMKVRRQFLLKLAAFVLSIVYVFATGHKAWSQTTRTIKLIVAVPPGGATDILARLLAEQIRRTQAGTTVVVENRPGADGVIGTEAVARASPDASTLLIAATPFVINPQLRKVNYNPLTSFEPICLLVKTPTVIVVNDASPYRTLAQFFETARTRPGQLTLASIGPGSPYHLKFEMLKHTQKLDLTFVPYAGNAPAVTALLGDHVTSMWGTYPDVAEQLRAGRLRALAVALPSRIEALPDAPTVAESGYENLEVEVWFGLVAPAKTPTSSISLIASWFSAAMQVPEVRVKLAVQGLYPVGMCGADFGAFLRSQYNEYGRVISEANIKAE